MYTGHKRFKKFFSISEAITFCTEQYYKKVSEDPAIRKDDDRHIATIEDLNSFYLKSLIASRAYIDYDKHKDGFIRNMDYLTGVFSRQREKSQLKQDKINLINDTKHNNSHHT